MPQISNADVRRSLTSCSDAYSLTLRERLATTDDSLPWAPQPGPQCALLDSEADEVYFGGAAGGGKTDCLLGCAALLHLRSIIFRREYPRLSAIVERGKEILAPFGDYNQQSHTWRLRPDAWAPRGRVIEFGAVQYEDDKQNFQGRPLDGVFFDELPEFTETQYLFLQGWCRTTVPGQRCRVIGAGNPPLDSGGMWVMNRWAAWLDPRHPRPAKPEELRWFIRGEDGKEEEVAGPSPIMRDGQPTQHPRSRTFIPARLADNPFNDTPQYRAQLNALPEPLRSKLLNGDFSTAIDGDALQVIPTAWVLAAQARWRPNGQALPLAAVGVDVARGGRDQTVIVKRYGGWVAQPIEIPGDRTPTGQEAARYIVAALEGEDGRPPVYIDSIGVGGAAFDFARGLCNAVGVNVATASADRDRSGQLTFANRKAALWWKLREMLDPSYGENLALPPHALLRADLCSCRWSVSARGISIEDKEAVKRRIGRSPDVGDALVLTLADTGPRLWSPGLTPRTPEVRKREAERAEAAFWNADDVE